MAIAFLMDFPNQPISKYHDVMEILDLGGKLPQGGVFHAASAFNGGIRVFDTWESEAAFNEFLPRRLMPALAKAGVPQPQVETLSVHRHLRYPEGEAASGGTGVLFSMTFQGTPTQYDEASRRLDLDHYFPSGAYFHAAAQGANGWRVIDCWRSPADFEAFGSQLIPVITELGFKPLGQDVSDIINLLSR